MDEMQVEMYCAGEKLKSSFRLMDVAYKTGWTQVRDLKLVCGIAAAERMNQRLFWL